MNLLLVFLHVLSCVVIVGKVIVIVNAMQRDTHIRFVFPTYMLGLCAFASGLAPLYGFKVDIPGVIFHVGMAVWLLSCRRNHVRNQESHHHGPQVL